MKNFSTKILLKKQLALTFKYFVIIILSCCLTLTIPAIANSQTPFSDIDSNSQNKFTPWWELNQVRGCGKFQCVDINFPHFPFHLLFNETKFTIASRASLEDPQDTTSELKNRASLIEQTLLSLYKKIIVYNHYNSDKNNLIKSQKLPLKYWFISNDKPSHYLTPKIEIGIKNTQTVIFTPPQPELGLAQETIVTITEDDSIYNGKSSNKLALQWREIIQRDLSQALWGYEFNNVFPWGRLQIIIAILIFIIVTIILLTIISRSIGNLDLQFKQKIRELHDLAKREHQASFFDFSKSPELTSTSKKIDKMKDSVDNNQGSSEEDNTVIDISSKANKSFSFRKEKLFLFKYLKFILNKFKSSKSKLKLSSTVILDEQNIIKQFQNLTKLLIQLIIWLRLLILFTGLILIFSIYPNTRITSFFFLVQAIFLPLIWMLANLADKITSFIIDYYLNRWAKEGQIVNPNSNRYPLRVATYSPALKGGSSFVFTIIGLVLTIELLGINTRVLAGAGSAALLIGFLARKVLEDMLNGILILWTDRYAIGDVISTGDLGGYVENMNLYITQIRGVEGRLITIPNGQIFLVQNQTKDWSRTEFKIEISLDSDPVKAIQILKEIGTEMEKDPDWQETILEPINILGVDQVSHQGILIQVWIKTQPMKHWSVGREFRLRVVQAFKNNGIVLGIPQRQIWHLENSSL